MVLAGVVIVDIYGDTVGRHSCGYDEFAHPLRRAVPVEGDKIRVTAGVAGGYLKHQGQTGRRRAVRGQRDCQRDAADVLGNRAGILRRHCIRVEEGGVVAGLDG